MLEKSEKGRSAPTPGPIMLDMGVNTSGESSSQPCDWRSPVEQAWQRYRALVLKAATEPDLLDDALHRRRMHRAHSIWSRLFVQELAS